MFRVAIDNQNSKKPRLTDCGIFGAIVLQGDEIATSFLVFKLSRQSGRKISVTHHPSE